MGADGILTCEHSLLGEDKGKALFARASARRTANTSRMSSIAALDLSCIHFVST